MFTVSTTQEILQKSKKNIALLILCALLVAALVTGAVFCLLNYKVEKTAMVENQPISLIDQSALTSTTPIIVDGNGSSIATVGGASMDNVTVSIQQVDPNTIFTARPYDIPLMETVTNETHPEMLALAIGLLVLALLPLTAILMGLRSTLTVDPTAVTGRAGIGKAVTLPVESIEAVRRNALFGTLTLSANGKKKHFFLLQNTKELEDTVNRLLSAQTAPTEAPKE